MDVTPHRLPTKEESMLVHEFIILPMILDILEKIHKDVELERHTLKKLFLLSIEKLQDIVHQDLVGIRKEMKRIGLEVWPVKDSKDYTTIRYVMKLRGYQDEFGVMREVLRSRLSVKLGAYIDGMFNGSGRSSI